MKGLFPIIRKNVPAKLRRDLYHDLLVMRWDKLIFFFFCFYLLINSFFATLYWLQKDAILNSDGSWASSFFFSIQTLGTIGYGQLSPHTTYANILVTIEATIGIILIAIMTGFFFAKFSRPLSKLEFTSRMVVGLIEGNRTLMFRMINIRENQIINLDVQMTALCHTILNDGKPLRKFIDMKLIRAKVPLVAMSMTIMHVIDEESPLFGKDEQELLATQIEFIVTAIGTDSTFGQTINSVHTFRPRDISWQQKFADMVEFMPDGTRIVDYGKFNELL